MENIQVSIGGVVVIIAISTAVLWAYTLRVADLIGDLKSRVSDLERKIEEINPRLR